MKPKRKPVVSPKDVDQNGSEEASPFDARAGRRFVQIAAVRVGNNRGSRLYALDLSGNVWVYTDDTFWTQLSDERQ